MIEVHRLPAADFADLARGQGGVDTINRLRTAQLSRRLLGLRVLLDLARSAECEGWYATLAVAQDRHPPAVLDVLAAPHTGAWIAATLRALRAGRPVTGELGYLGALAVVAAAAAGLPAEVVVPVHEGAVMLPRHGRVAVPGRAQLRLRSADGALWVDDRRVPTGSPGGVRTDAGSPAGAGAGPVGHERADDGMPGWQPLRTIAATAAGLTVRLCLDDLDPYRNCGQRAAAERLDAAAVAGWQRLLDEAWPILVESHRGYAEAIAAGLTTVVPLRAVRADQGMNVTSNDAFGAMSLTRPADALGLALALVHEFQHAKLWALLDIERLHDDDDEPRYYAPWRDDPRPLGGLLHGVYAFLAVTDFWRVQRHHLRGGAAAAADREFARWRALVYEAHRGLAASTSFTPAGRRFLDGMRETLTGFRTVPVPAAAETAAGVSAADHRIGWRLRNVRPDPGRIAGLAADWLAGRASAGEPVPTRIAPASDDRLFRTGRQDLDRLRLTRPARFREVCADPRLLPEVAPEACAADLAFVRGDHAAAVGGYLAMIAEAPDRVAAWAGLALAAPRPPAPAVRALTECPEVVYAVHLAVRAAGAAPPDPLALAAWLAPPTGTDAPVEGAAAEGRLDGAAADRPVGGAAAEGPLDGAVEHGVAAGGPPLSAPAITAPTP
ncbi:HEXXH motif-containing putative peptide modification protein [Plantactinospora siamensis]|uniref:HEXXH motif-containing putative peptide modification protein n=1 Tax=Plantactinospora siamensis TaxID=555372 RepID=A0ABV6NZ02_9ACTN